VAEIVVFGFPKIKDADDALPTLDALQRERLIALVDWARVERHDDGKVDVRQGHNTTAAGAGGGALWGILIGMLFLMPFAGALIGGVFGALTGAVTDYGINDRFIHDVAAKLQPGTSALFLYVTQMTDDKVIGRLKDYQPTLIRTSLSNEAEQKLREAMQATVPA